MSAVYIIAEAGVNHNGSMAIAKELVDVAANSGANAIKFQTFKAEKLAVAHAEKSVYQKDTTDQGESFFDMIKRLELSEQDHEELIVYCKSRCIDFLSTPFDVDSVNFLHSKRMEVFKTASGEITNLPYLRAIGQLNKKVVMSTGLSSLGDIESALAVLMEAGTPRKSITVLHANTAYPTPFSDVNLKAMITIRDAFEVDVGYSDHTLGISVPTAAVALGASLIEKHFTLDRGMDGPDHRASLIPSELSDMVKAIREVEEALGDGIKQPSASELVNHAAARKSIVAEKDIAKGEVFTECNLSVKRPGGGVTPMRWDEFIGKLANRNYSRNELI